MLGKDYEFSIDPSSLTFFGVDLVESNRFLASSAELGQSLYATVTVYQHISDGNRPLLDISMGNSPVYAQDIPVECNLGDDGRWKINLSDIMRKHVSGSMNIGQKMSGMPDECFDIELTFTETTPTILGDEGMVTYKTNPTGSIYIYSRKVPKVYNLTFKPNGGSGTMDPATVTEGNQYTLPSCKFTAPKDKKFRGWAVLRDRYYEHFMAGDKIDIDKDTEILAEWEDCTYRVTFYANDSAGTREDYYPVRNTYFTLPGCSFAPPSKAKAFQIILQRIRASSAAVPRELHPRERSPRQSLAAPRPSSSLSPAKSPPTPSASSLTNTTSNAKAGITMPPTPTHVKTRWVPTMCLRRAGSIG